MNEQKLIKLVAITESLKPYLAVINNKHVTTAAIVEFWRASVKYSSVSLDFVFGKLYLEATTFPDAIKVWHIGRLGSKPFAVAGHKDLVWREITQLTKAAPLIEQLIEVLNAKG